MALERPELPAWLKRQTLLRARVEITPGENGDYAILLALPVADVTHAQAEFAKLQEAGDLNETVLPLVDELLTRTIELWALKDTAQAYGISPVPTRPSDLIPDERDRLWRSLPLSLLLRLLEGLMAHSGNS